MSRDVAKSPEPNSVIIPSVIVLPLRFRGNYRSPALQSWLSATSLPVQPIECFDHADLNDSIKRKLYWPLGARLIYGRELTSREIAASRSHDLALLAGLEAGAEWTVVLEDDVDPQPALEALLKELQSIRICEPRFLNLAPAQQLRVSKSRAADWPEALLSTYRLRPVQTYVTNAQCYVVNRRALEVMMGNGPQTIVRPPDFPPRICRTRVAYAPIGFYTVPETSGASTVGDRPDISVSSRIARWVLRLLAVPYLLARQHYGPFRVYWRYEVLQRMEHRFFRL